MSRTGSTLFDSIPAGFSSSSCTGKRAEIGFALVVPRRAKNCCRIAIGRVRSLCLGPRTLFAKDYAVARPGSLWHSLCG